MEQANNGTYLLESFHKLVHDLEEPLGVSSSPNNLLSSCPCAAWPFAMPLILVGPLQAA